MEENTKNARVTIREEILVDWESIYYTVKNGKMPFSVGDTITGELKDGREFTVEVAAINPYEQNTVALVFKDIVDYHCMNKERANKGGWRDSDMRKWLNEEFIELLPDDLREVIKERTIVQKQDGVEIVSTDKLWLPSRTEVCGGDYLTNVGDVQFDLFKDKRNRAKCDSGSSAWWWGRSPYYRNYNYFCSVSTYGGACYRNASSSGGVAPAFIL